jgi:hypothetical protein
MGLPENDKMVVPLDKKLIKITLFFIPRDCSNGFFFCQFTLECLLPGCCVVQVHQLLLEVVFKKVYPGFIPHDMWLQFLTISVLVVQKICGSCFPSLLLQHLWHITNRDLGIDEVFDNCPYTAFTNW